MLHSTPITFPAATINIALVAVMIIMQSRIYLMFKKTVHLLLLVGLIVSAGAEFASMQATTQTQLLQFAAVILVNLGIFIMYARISRAKIIVAVMAFIVPLFTAIFQVAPIIGLIGMEGIQILFALYCLWLISPQIGVSAAHRIAMALYIIALSAGVLIKTEAVTEAWGQYIIILADTLYFLMLFVCLLEIMVQMMQNIMKKSVLDGLTGLLNRRAINERIKACIKAGDCALVFCDIDNFKKLNDSQGHDVGDDTLRRVAAILKQQCADVGFAGRFGGEEMVAVISDPEIIKRMPVWTEQLRQRIQNETRVTASIGYSLSRPGIDSDSLIKLADDRMYKAKQTGKNRVVGQ